MQFIDSAVCSNKLLRQPGKRVVLGIERIDEPFAKQLLAGKRLGLFTNKSGVDSKLSSSTELLQKSYNLTALFVPEHGLFGAVAAGETFESHTYKDIPVHSLYQEVEAYGKNAG